MPEASSFPQITQKALSGVGDMWPLTLRIVSPAGEYSWGGSEVKE